MNEQSLYQQSANQQTPEHPLPEPPQLESPPRSKTTIFIIGGVVFLILLVVVTIIFFLVRARTGTPQGKQQKSGSSTLTPQPPSFYESVTQDIQGQEVKLSGLENDMKLLDQVLMYEPVNFSDVLTPTPPQTLEWQAQKTEIAKARAELEIDRRTAILYSLIPKIDSSKKTSLGQKSQLDSEVSTEIANLSSLKKRVTSQTNFQAVVSDINILSDYYKNYAIVVPKVLIVTIADKINVMGDTFTNIADKLAQKTEQLEKLKKDVASVQKTLGHMLYVLGDAVNKAEIALISVLPLSPQDYPKNEPVLSDAKSKIKTSSQNLKSAVKDARTSLNLLKAIESGKAPQRNFFRFLPFPLTQ
jgi:hypothetical protein